MLFGQGCFQLRADGFNAFNLVENIETSAGVTGEGGKPSWTFAVRAVSSPFLHPASSLSPK